MKHGRLWLGVLGLTATVACGGEAAPHLIAFETDQLLGGLNDGPQAVAYDDSITFFWHVENVTECTLSGTYETCHPATEEAWIFPEDRPPQPFSNCLRDGFLVHTNTGVWFHKETNLRSPVDVELRCQGIDPAIELVMNRHVDVSPNQHPIGQIVEPLRVSDDTGPLAIEVDPYEVLELRGVCEDPDFRPFLPVLGAARWWLKESRAESNPTSALQFDRIGFYAQGQPNTFPGEVLGIGLETGESAEIWFDCEDVYGAFDTTPPYFAVTLTSSVTNE